MNMFSKKQIVIGVVVVLVVACGFVLFGGKKPVDTKNTAVTTRGDITQEVSVTGRVKAATTVDLGFEKSARVQDVYVKIGNHVNQGDLLAQVESSTQEAALLEAQARLTELKRGARPEELAVKGSELAKYKQDLTNAYNGILDTTDDAFNKSDDALHSKTTGIFTGFVTSAYTITYSVCDSQLTQRTTSLRASEETDLNSWRAERVSFPTSPSQSDLSRLLDTTATHLEKIKTFFESLNNTLVLDCTITNTALDTYRSNVSLARANIATALSAVNTKSQSISALLLTVKKVQDELALLQAGQASEVVGAQEARVLGAEGDLRKTKIYAPISGTITKVDAVVGEFATLATPLISIISDNSFEVEANVPEADIAKIKISDIARITLDAYGPDVLFQGTVTTINPAETIIDNVPTYKVTLHFAKEDPRIKSGMTANIDISTDSRKNVLFIPARAVITKNDKKFVSVQNIDGTTTETLITVGLRGSDGSIEVLSGITEGARIVTTVTQ